MAQDGMEDQNLRLNVEQEDCKNWVLEPVNDEQQYGLDLLWIPISARNSLIPWIPLPWICRM